MRLLALSCLNHNNLHSAASSRPLVIWNLHRAPEQEVRCVATKVGNLYALTVCRETTHSARPMPERYSDIVSIVGAADQLKQKFLDRGWREPTAELHPRGSGAYGQLTVVPSAGPTDTNPTWVDYCGSEATPGDRFKDAGPGDSGERPQSAGGRTS